MPVPVNASIETPLILICIILFERQSRDVAVIVGTIGNRSFRKLFLEVWTNILLKNVPTSYICDTKHFWPDKETEGVDRTHKTGIFDLWKQQRWASLKDIKCTEFSVIEKGPGELCTKGDGDKSSTDCIRQSIEHRL